MDLPASIIGLGSLLTGTLGAILAAAEAAFALQSRARAQRWEEENVPGARTLRYLLVSEAPPLAALRTLLLLTSLALGTLFAYTLWGARGMFGGMVALAVVLPTLEVATRAVALHNPDRAALALARPASLLLALAHFPIALLLLLAAPLRAAFLSVMRRAAVTVLPSPEQPEQSEEEREEREEMQEDFRDEMEELGPEQVQMIRGVLDMGDLTVRSVMVPRIDMVALEVGTPLSEAADLVIERGFSRIPVYEGSLDRITGILYAKELLRALHRNDVESLRALLRPASFVPDSKPIAELLRDFRQSRVHLAIVVDEYGGTAGLVTIEDVLEEIVGEIHDEFETGREEPETERQADGSYVVDARVTLNDLAGLMDTELEEEEVLTVGGLLAGRLGRIPVVGDVVDVDSFRLTVLSMRGRRPHRVKVASQSVQEAPEPQT